MQSTLAKDLWLEMSQVEFTADIKLTRYMYSRCILNVYIYSLTLALSQSGFFLHLVMVNRGTHNWSKTKNEWLLKA